MSGNTQGDRKDTSPARNASGIDGPADTPITALA